MECLFAWWRVGERLNYTIKFVDTAWPAVNEDDRDGVRVFARSVREVDGHGMRREWVGDVSEAVGVAIQSSLGCGPGEGEEFVVERVDPSHGWS